MIKNIDADVLIDYGRCEGGLFVRVIHRPTMLMEYQGYMAGMSPETVATNLLYQMEKELLDKGHGEYIEAEPPLN